MGALMGGGMWGCERMLGEETGRGVWELEGESWNEWRENHGSGMRRGVTGGVEGLEW
jgi:hypothetical protein